MARSVTVTYQVWPTAAEMALASARKFAATVEAGGGDAWRGAGGDLGRQHAEDVRSSCWLIRRGRLRQRAVGQAATVLGG